MAKTTDLNQFRDMLDRADIGHQRIDDDEGPVVALGEYGDYLMTRVKGTECYTGFYAKFHFTSKGKLRKVGIWE